MIFVLQTICPYLSNFGSRQWHPLHMSQSDPLGQSSVGILSLYVQQVALYNDSVRRELEPMVITALCRPEADCTGSCEDDSHNEKLSCCYTALTKAITSSGSNSFQRKPTRKKHPGLVPGWNEAVRVRHGVARRAFLRWRACGSPKDGRVALLMRYARLSFKYALRKCKRERDIIM